MCLLVKCDGVSIHYFKFLFIGKNVLRQGWWKLGKVYKVKVDIFIVRRATLLTPTMDGCAHFFADWMARIGNPLYLLKFPLRESTQTF